MDNGGDHEYNVDSDDVDTSEYNLNNDQDHADSDDASDDDGSLDMDDGEMNDKNYNIDDMTTLKMETKVGPCRVLAEGGCLGGLLAPRFQFSYFESLRFNLDARF